VIARLLTALGALLVLGAVDYGALQKESIRRGGELVYLELAPVDPRSLMQGDYMALRFRLAQEIGRRRAALPSDAARPAALPEGDRGVVALALDERRIATLAEAADPSALHLRYRIRRGAVWIGTNAWFFEEGQAQHLRVARYGEFRLDKASGEAVLVGLRDASLQRL
jgi:uncharacterized membrane-anchored protein